MEGHSLILLLITLVLCLLISGFFSASETAMMSVNRYRLKYQAKVSKGAKRVQDLLEQPDRLLGVILLGNTFVNIAASAIATLIAVNLFGEIGVLISSFLITFFLLVFSEVSPKTLAVLYPEKVALPCSLILKFLLAILYPLVYIINVLSNGILKLFGVSLEQADNQGMTQEELRTVVHETAGRIPSKHRKMLLSILDLEKVSVDDIMVPRNEIIGLDLEHDWESTLGQLANIQHTFLPVFKQDVNQLIGVLHAKKALHLIMEEDFDEQKLRDALDEGFFIPEGTNLTTQLINFQKSKQRLAFVVDEYGDIIGLITLEDILEEIVGEFTTDIASVYTAIFAQDDGTYLVEGSTTIREFNRIVPWKLSSHGPKTINGLIIEHLQMIPEVGTCCMIENIPIEVVHVQDNRIKSVKVMKPLEKKEEES